MRLRWGEDRKMTRLSVAIEVPVIWYPAEADRACPGRVDGAGMNTPEAHTRSGSRSRPPFGCEAPKAEMKRVPRGSFSRGGRTASTVGGKAADPVGGLVVEVEGVLSPGV